jgi:type I restriction enzyme, R subunit
LDELVKKRRQADIEHKEYLAKVIELSKEVKNPEQSSYYPPSVNTKAKQSLFDNLGNDEAKALAVHEAVIASRQADFRGNRLKERAIKLAIRRVAPELTDEGLNDLFEIIKSQHEY